MRRPGLPIAVLALAAGFAGQPPAQPLDMSSIAGAYALDKLIAVPPDPVPPGSPPGHPPVTAGDWVRQETTDRLLIEPVGPGAAFVMAELTFTNYHTCSLADVMEAEAGALVLRVRDEIENRRCVLRLRITGTQLVFDDEPMDGLPGCQPLFCGARGSLDRAAFPRASRQIEPPSPDPAAGGEEDAATARRDAIEAWRARQRGG